MAAAHGVSGHHRHHRLRQPPDLHVEVADVEAPHALLSHLVVADVAVVAADRLVAAGAERLGSGSREDDRRDLEVVTRPAERVAQLGQGLGAKRVPDLGAVDGDLRDPLRLLVEDVAEVASGAPLDRRVELILGGCVLVSTRHAGIIASPH